MTTAATSTIFDFLSFEATREQAKALYQMQEFLNSDCDEDVFILKGAAGTGKTSLVKAVVDYLENQQIGCYLTAPTGRAAKVLGYKTRMLAHTVHHTIYRVLSSEDEKIIMDRRVNSENAYSIFIVDEASMISDVFVSQGNFITPGSMLEDLLAYAKEGNSRNKIIFIGDRYQLAPVRQTESLALNLEYFRSQYRLSGQEAELTEVKRQSGQSTVLDLAGEIRRKSDMGVALGKLPIFALGNYTASVTRYLNLYDANRLENVVMIGMTNKTVHSFNTAVRKRLSLTGALSVGDQVVVNENWIDKAGQLVVKGETGLVREISSAIENKGGLQFGTASIEFRDPDHQPILFTTKVLLDTLMTDTGNVPAEALKSLKADRMAKNHEYRENQHPANDPFMGAMRLKYGHGLTGYKAQGGEWNHVLLHPYFNPNDYRYAYTAVTRARESVASWATEYSWWR